MLTSLLYFFLPICKIRVDAITIDGGKFLLLSSCVPSSISSCKRQTGCVASKMRAYSILLNNFSKRWTIASRGMCAFCHYCNTLTWFACDPWLSSDIPLVFLTSQLTIHRSPYSDNLKNNSTHFQVSLYKHCRQVTSNSMWHRTPFPLSHLHLESALLMSKLLLDPMMMYVLKD